MQKVKWLICLMLVVIAGILGAGNEHVGASEIEGDASQAIYNIAEEKSGEYILITEDTCMKEIVIQGEGKVDTVIKVESGARLEVDNLVIDVESNIGIENNGSLYVKKLVITSKAKMGIKNYAGSIILEEVDIPSIYLEDGYIEVNENTKIEGKIGIDLSSTKEVLPSTIVRGNGVYAGYYLDKFEYVGDGEITTSWDTYTPVLDYVGFVDNVKESKKEDLKSKSLQEGDIILTVPSGKNNDVVVANAYCTGGMYLASSKLNTKTYSFASTFYDKSSPQKLDNYHIVVKDGAVTALDEVSKDVVNLEVKTVCDDTEEKESKVMGVGGDYLVYVDMLSLDYKITATNLTYKTLYENKSHIAILVTHTGEDLDASIEVTFNTSKEVNVKLEEDTFTYTGSNIYPELKAYYIDGEEKEYLKIEEKEIILVGDYEIKVSTDKENILLDTDTLNVKVQPKEMHLEYTQTSNTYTKEDIYVIATPTDNISKEELGLTLTNATKKNAGNYIVAASISNANYVLDEDSKEYAFVIQKANVDITNITLLNAEIEYIDSEYIPKLSGVPEEVKVEYSSISSKLSVGEHTIILELSLKDTNNYMPLSISRLERTVLVIAKKIDVSKVEVNNLNTPFNSSIHSLTLANLPDKVTYTSTKNEYIDAGEYTITFTLAPINSNYELVGDTILTGTLVISSIPYILDVEFEDKEVTYTGRPQTIELNGTLPDGLGTEPCTEYINAGEYTITLNFINTNSNYITPTPLTAKLKILPKELDISLVKDSIGYTGKEIEVKYILDGILLEDIVEVTLKGNKNTRVGSYTAIVDSVSNSNYVLTKEELLYTITKANVDMSGVTLEDREITYTGEVYTPSITGSLPEGVISVEYTHREIKNVDEYTVVASFTVDSNYNKPKDIQAKIEILPKPVVVHFSNNLNLMYTGKAQYVTVELIGMVDNEEYTIQYSKEPVEAGNYTCEVILSKDSNYELKGDTILFFDIHLSTLTTTTDKYTLTVSEGIFKVDRELSVEKISLNTDVTTKLDTLHKENECIEAVKIISEDKEEKIKINLELKDLDLRKGKGLVVYTLGENGTLKEVSFSVDNNCLNLELLPNTTIILVKERIDHTTTILLVTIAILTLCISLLTVYMALRKHKLAKKMGKEENK